MAVTQVFRPQGSVTLVTHLPNLPPGSGSGDPNAGVVGTSPWSDGDDSTYALVGGVNTQGADYATVPFPTVPGDPALITAASVTLRISNPGSANTSASFRIAKADSTATQPGLVGDADDTHFALAAGAGPVTISDIPLDFGDLPIGNVLTQTNLAIYIWPNGSPVELKIHEVSVKVTRTGTMTPVPADTGTKAIQFTVANQPIYGTALLFPGSDPTVADAATGTPTPYAPPASIVGSGDILSDEDDTTMLRAAYYNNAASNGGAANTDASIGLPVVTAGDYQTGTFGWVVRAAGELSGTTDAVPNLRVLLMSSDLATIYADGRVDPMPMGGPPQEHSGTFTFYGTAGYAALEAGTARLWFVMEQTSAPTTTTDYMFVANIYEAHLTYQRQIGNEVSTLTLKGPSTPDQGDSNRHRGMFGIDPHSRHVSVRFKVGSTDHDVWVRPVVRYFSVLNDIVVGQGEARLPATQVLAAPKWNEVNQYVEQVPASATHYLIDAEMYGDAALSQILPNGTKVFFDSLFVPDGGHDLRDDAQPYLDGDQPGAIWEGTPENSTSIYGEKPRTPNSLMTLLDDDLAYYIPGSSTPGPAPVPPDTPPPPPPITEP